LALITILILVPSIVELTGKYRPVFCQPEMIPSQAIELIFLLIFRQHRKNDAFKAGPGRDISDTYHVTLSLIQK